MGWVSVFLSAFLVVVVGCAAVASAVSCNKKEKCPKDFQCLDENGEVAKVGTCYAIGQNCAEDNCPPRQVCVGTEQPTCAKAEISLVHRFEGGGDFTRVALVELKEKSTARFSFVRRRPPPKLLARAALKIAVGSEHEDNSLMVLRLEKAAMAKVVGVQGVIQCIKSGPAKCLELPVSKNLLKRVASDYVSGTEDVILMEACPGGDLHDDANGVFSLKADPHGIHRLTGMIELASGLHNLNRLWFIHKDIKAENVFLKCPSGGLATLGDLGFAQRFTDVDDYGCLLDTKYKQRIFPSGTPGFVAPEILIPTHMWDSDFDKFASKENAIFYTSANVSKTEELGLKGCFRKPASSADIFALAHVFVFIAFHPHTERLLHYTFDDVKWKDFADGNYVQLLAKTVKKSKLVSFDTLVRNDDIFNRLLLLLANMFDWNQTKRPSPQEVVERLEAIRKSLKAVVEEDREKVKGKEE